MLAVSKFRYQRQFLSLLCRSTYSTSVLGKSRIEKVITKVDNDVRRIGRILKKDVDFVFEGVKKLGFSKDSHSLILLRCCGSLLCELTPEARNELVEEVWSTLKASDVKLNVSHYNALLNVYNENNKSFHPTDLLAEMESNGVEANRVTYQRLLHRYCQTGDIEGALKILEHMKSKSLPLTEAIFNSLILGYSRSGDVDASIAVINQMESVNVDVTNNTFRTLLCSLCENLMKGSDVEQKLNETLKRLEDKDVQMTDKDWLDVVSTIAKVDEKSPLIDSFLAKCKKSMGYNHECVNVIVELINANKLDSAMKILHSMIVSPAATETSNFGSFFVTQLVKAGVDPETVLKICDALYSDGLNIHSYSKAAEVSFEFEDLEKSKFYLKSFLSKTGQICKPHYLWPLLAKCKTDDEILSILMEDFAPIASGSSFTSVADTFTDYVWPKVKMDPYIFIERCKEFGFSDITLISSLVKHKLMAHKLDEVAAIVNDERYFHKNLLGAYITNDLNSAYSRTGDVENMVSILKKFATVSTTARDPVGSCLLQLVQNWNIDVAGRVFPLLKAMKSNNVFITSTYADLIIEKDKLSPKEKSFVTSLVNDGRVPQETFTTSVEELEKQYADLLSRGILARGTLRQLVMAYCRKEIDTSTEEGIAELKATRDRIEKLLAELSDTSGSFTKGLRALLVNFYTTKCEDLDAALKYKNMDSTPLDVSKIINLARLMLSKGKVDDAIKLLNEESEKERDTAHSIARGRIDNDIIRMANIAAEVTKDSQLVKQLLDVATKFCRVKVNHVMLEPVVKVHLLNNNFEKAIEEFKNCIEMYNCAPANVDLMVQAVKNEDSEKLQMITDLSNTTQGDHNTLFDLAVAFIRCGKIKQANKVTSTAGLRINERRLKSFSSGCVRQNEIHILEQAIPLLKNVFEVNMDDLYYDLLRGYAKTGNVEKGHELWTQMQEDNIIMSDRTIRFLSNFLNESGKNVSFAVEN